MQRYLWLLVPLALSWMLSLLFSTSEPRSDARDLVGSHDWLSSGWMIVGIVVAIVGGLTLAIHDLFEWLDRRHERRLLDRRDRRSEESTCRLPRHRKENRSDA